MKLKLQQDLTKQEIEILVEYAQMNRDVRRLITLIKSADTQIKCQLNNTKTVINASEVYYIESVDKRTFVYGKEAVYRTSYRLYQLMEDLQHLGFVQISKSCILNINILTSIKPLLNSRMEATLSNGERLTVTRKYLDDIKSALQEVAR